MILLTACCDTDCAFCIYTAHGVEAGSDGMGRSWLMVGD